MYNEIEKILLHSNYKAEFRSRIKNDIQANLRNFQNFRLGLTAITDNGSPFKVCVLEGFLPAVYQNITYNIPVSCLITPRYPYSAPIIYVRNPPSTSIQPSEFLDPNGIVKHPSVTGWDPRHSNLGRVLLDVSKGFSQNFPIVSVAPNNPAQNIYFNLGTLDTLENHFTPDPQNPTHSIYFIYQEQIREIQNRIEAIHKNINNQPNLADTFKNLKNSYFQLFINQRKQEKALKTLSNLG
jgi:UEV domain